MAEIRKITRINDVKRMTSSASRIDKIRAAILKSPIVKWYYRAQLYVDIAWGEFSWFTDSLIEIMAILYVLEKIGVNIEGVWVIFMIVAAYLLCFLLGKLFKAIGTYDISSIVAADIDPVRAKEYEAAKIIIKKFGEKNDQR